MTEDAAALRVTAERAIRLLDLTSLGASDNDGTVAELCKRALAVPAPLAADNGYL